MRKTKNLVAFFLSLQLIVISAPLTAQMPESGAGPIKPASEILGLLRGPENMLMVYSSDQIVRYDIGAPQTIILAQPVDALAILKNGLAFALRGDTLGLALGARPFEGMLRLPKLGMKIKADEQGNVYIFGGYSPPGTSEMAGVYKLHEGSQLTRVAGLAQPVVDIAAYRDSLFIATDHLIYRLTNGRILPYFSEQGLFGIRALDVAPNGSMYIASEQGVLMLKPGGNKGWWLSKEPTDAVLWMPDAIYMLRKDQNKISKMPFR